MTDELDAALTWGWKALVRALLNFVPAFILRRTWPLDECLKAVSWSVHNSVLGVTRDQAMYRLNTHVLAHSACPLALAVTTKRVELVAAGNATVTLQIVDRLTLRQHDRKELTLRADLSADSVEHLRLPAAIKLENGRCFVGGEIVVVADVRNGLDTKEESIRIPCAFVLPERAT